MNECHFIGKFTSDPVLSKVDDTSYVHFRLSITRKFKKTDGSNGLQINYLDFEVWDTAAEVIARNFKQGDTIIITNASARSETYKDVTNNKILNIVRFRVDRFEFPS